MKAKNPNAFPIKIDVNLHEGRKLLDFFVAHIAQGMMAFGHTQSKHIATKSYEIAHQMLIERQNYD